MDFEELKVKMKSIQNIILEFLEDESNAEENYENFIKLVSQYHIKEDKQEVKSILRLINTIGNNHQRNYNFISKIEQLLEHFKEEIQKYLSNSEIFEVFKDNQRILLFLISEKMMIIDEYIASQITSNNYINKYAKFFRPEIKPFLTEEFILKNRKQNVTLWKKEFIDDIKKEITEDFYDKRKEGENDNYLCELIRNNEVKEFGVHVNRNNISFDSHIDKSIFETNPLLNVSFSIKLIEYASFYGSIDIIRYMRINGQVELPSSMWIYAIHSRNAELIKYLEDNHVSPPANDYEIILEESIKCHHNDVSKYIIDYLMKEEVFQNDTEKKYYNNVYRYAVEHHNYCYFPTNIKYKNMFFYLCEFDYYNLVKHYLMEETIDINAKIKISII